MEMFIAPITPLKLIASEETPKEYSEITIPFQNILNDAMQGLEDATKVSEQDSYDLAMGNVNDLAQLQINSMKTSYMMQTTVQLTTRMVNAYKEIMQMQV